jgi:hypothetical protein
LELRYTVKNLFQGIDRILGEGSMMKEKRAKSPVTVMRTKEGVIGKCYINIGASAEQPNNAPHPKASFL